MHSSKKGKGCLQKSRRLKVSRHDSFKIELSNSPRGENLTIPETENQYRYTGGGVETTSAIEKAEEYSELCEEKGAPVSAEEVRRNAKIKAKARKELGRDGRRGELPPYLTPEEIMEFREWCKDRDIDIEKEKPKTSMLALTQQKDEVLDELFNHIGEWKSARKIMFDRLHPDKGGNTLAFQFAKMFDELMLAMQKLVAWVEYEDAVIAYKKEWWKNRGAKNGE